MHPMNPPRQEGESTLGDPMIFTAYPDGLFDLGDRMVRCALGRAGVVTAAAKREGDGCSPAGVWPVRRLLYRPDRGPVPATRLPSEALSPSEGWCDESADAAYNRPVSLPYRASAEPLWREDGLYDLIVVLGHNDAPVIPGAGSAIFLHVAAPGYAPTEGCVALARGDLQLLLARAGVGDALAISLDPCRP
jgi:L,D-peptidoglycan transpeptidase YkuD (ErfK/YbiS/YcfS/YnhG family)